MITGLVAITPAAGVIAGWGAIIMGVCSGAIPWLSMNYLGRTALFRKVDDCLGVFHTHAVAGVVGGFMTGILATKDGCAAFGITNPGGAIEGNGTQVWLQIVGALFIIGWNIVWTSLILFGLSLVMPLRMSEDLLMVGDDAIHGEEAYAFFGEGDRTFEHWDHPAMNENLDGDANDRDGSSGSEVREVAPMTSVKTEVPVTHVEQV
jgi:Amt family ammonium transporter